MTRSIVSLVVLAPLLILEGCTSQQAQIQSSSPVTIGIQASPAMALVMVAEDKGFFIDQGLNVKLQQFTAGKFALQAFLAGSLDYAISGEVPVTLATLQGNSLVVPAQVVAKTMNEVRIVARRDNASTTAQQYFNAKPRTIATSFGGGPEFFTYEFLRKIGVTNAHIVSQTPSDMPAALVNGSVDAISIFDPFAYIAETKLGSGAVTFTDSSTYSELYVLDAHQADTQDPSRLEKILKAMIVAQQYTAAHPQDAQAIVMKYTGLDQKTVESIWHDFDFRIALTPELNTYLNEEVTWAKNTGKTPASTQTPDFSRVIYLDALRAIDPQAVQ